MSDEQAPVTWRGRDLSAGAAILAYHGRMHIDAIRGAADLPDLDGSPLLEEVLPSGDYEIEMRVVRRITRASP
jgi:hypothetical protein